MRLSSVEEAIEEINAGRCVIVVDDDDRENEGDLTMAAAHVTPAAINFMATHGRGLICTALERVDFQRLNIPLMVSEENNRSRFGTAFGVSVGAVDGVTTGISAHDRARTVQILADPDSSSEELATPGHVFPLRAQENGVLRRRGHTEAAVDLARLAGLRPAGVICEILNRDGTMARRPQLEVFAAEHQLKIVSIEDLAAYRRQHEPIVKRVESAEVPTKYGCFQAYAFRDHKGLEHLAMCLGKITGKAIGEPQDAVLVRLHSACLTGDVFGSDRCDCGQQLDLALKRIGRIGRGVVLYLAQEGRGIGLANKIKAYALQDRGMDTVEANRHLGFPDDARTYDVGAAILRDLGVTTVQLMTNNPNKVDELEACGIKVVERLSHRGKAHAKNRPYLKAKAEKLGHILSADSGEAESDNKVGS